MPRTTISDDDFDSIDTETIESSKDITEGDWVLVDQRDINHDSYAATVTEIIGHGHARIDVTPDDPDDPGMAIDIAVGGYSRVVDAEQLGA